MAAKESNKKSNITLSKKIANYTLDNPSKITFEFLKSHLWSAADILRGSLDASEYRQPVMTLLFLKRLNDTFEENAEKLRDEFNLCTSTKFASLMLSQLSYRYNNCNALC